MPGGISRLAALVIPMALLMPLSPAEAQAPAAPIDHHRLQIAQVAGDFIIRAATEPSAPAPVNLGSTIRIDRALLARPARTIKQGDHDEVR